MHHRRTKLAAAIVWAVSIALVGAQLVAAGPAGAAAAANAEQVAFDYFRGLGLSDIQSAGIIGNLDQESGMDPEIHQRNGGPGRGIAQWETGGRWDTDANNNVLWYADKQGTSPTSLDLQLSFIWYELSTFSEYGLAALQNSHDVPSATIAFENHFEGCSNCDEKTRISYANAALAAYGSTPQPPVASTVGDLARNGGFNNGFSYWKHGAGTNVQVYGSSNFTKPYEGTGYLATNTSASGGSVAQDVSANISAGRTYCVSADLTTVGAGSGAGGTLAIWLTGGSGASEGSNKPTGALPGNNSWTQQTACVTATRTHTLVRVQFYPKVGGPTVGVDAVDVNPDIARNGGFNNGFSYWTHGSGTNVQTYGPGAVTKPYEGTGYLATNTSVPGGSVAQTVSATVTAGSTYCASAFLTSVGSNAGGSGSLALYLTGGTPEASSVPTGTLPGNNTWKQRATCVTATASHSGIRVQFNPTRNGPTVGVDAVNVNVNADIARNGGFNNGFSYWKRGGSTNVQVYGNTAAVTRPVEGTGYLASNTSTSGGSVAQDVAATITVGNTYCASAYLTTVGSGSGARGTLAIWLTGASNASEGSNKPTGALPGNGAWTQQTACVTATRTHSILRVQFYPKVNGATVGIDAVNVH